MLKRVCCLNLRQGSIATGLIRLLHWLLLLVAVIYVAVQVMHPDNGFFMYQAKVDIEQNSYILFLIMLVSLGGIGVECILLYGLFKKKPLHLIYWYLATIICVLLSIALALNFILGILEIPSRPATGKNFFFDAFCVLFHIVFFFIPEYLFGPRLQPVLTAIMIIVHVCLPMLHAYSFMIVRSYYKTVRYTEYLDQLTQENGIEASAPIKKCQNLCQKCQMAQQEKNGYQCGTNGPHVNPIETTC